PGAEDSVIGHESVRRPLSMSPEIDHKPEPSALEPPAGEPAANNFPAAPAPAAQAQSASGAATAVARAQEQPASVAPASDYDVSQASDANEIEGSETALPAETSAPAETVEATETMDQLLDQFSAPQPAGEGEIFDGRVLAVTDAGVVVDVGGKFEGLVPAQEFLDSGNPIEFGS